ncbi:MULTISPECIES: hypothetical protein [unclassified Streptomyces]|uniref:hypothetical protein n=1 Tax=unclassified Streptomyces TaxID=2593676 RepID=UPI00190C0D4C|nr:MULTISPECIES: hypothetical protein [unclassified Streptomyces]MBK3563219.1 hypothetical protein [Streptomyces sp. MBT62]MBK6013208.1 hypothetical protein [Streptomyces sp. MBT53]
MTNKYKIEAPVRTFSGDSVGVTFTKGTGFVDDSTKEGRAAIEYFRRHGYGVELSDGKTDEERAQEIVTGVVGQRGPIVTDEPFDPSKHDAPEVLAYLDSLGADDSDAVAEFARVIAAEREGKARKTILARGEQKQEAGQ